jgi:hypothetical protein
MAVKTRDAAIRANFDQAFQIAGVGRAFSFESRSGGS